MARKKPLSKQVVVIGGGSYGLGRAIAGEAARRGAKVVVGARTAEALADLSHVLVALDKSNVPKRRKHRRGRPRRRAWSCTHVNERARHPTG